MKYVDKNGTEIVAGAVIHCVLDDSYEKVVACGDNDLGIQVGKPGRFSEHDCYPLCEFDTKNDWEVVS